MTLNLERWRILVGFFVICDCGAHFKSELRRNR